MAVPLPGPLLPELTLMKPSLLVADETPLSYAATVRRQDRTHP